jgi:acyl-CoA reductase-like NAD-dependent aldehyde dehydrogenase
MLMSKLVALMEKHADELAALEALDNGQYPGSLAGIRIVDQ